MTRTVVTRTIHAPVSRVFTTVAHIEEFSKAIPHIVKFEYLSESKSGAGTRFRETRLMNGKEMLTELEVKEYVENERVRMVADSHGTVWDSLLTVRPEGENTLLTVTMDAITSRMFNRIMNVLIKGMVRKGMERDFNAVKTYCEK
jgi:hypothetical protein